MAKAGDVALFIGKKGFVDDSIEFFTGSKYTHAGFYIDNYTIIEAWFTGVRLRDMIGVTAKYDVFTLKSPRTQEQINKGIEYAKSKLKIRYNILALLGIVVEKITGIHHNIFYSKYLEICSELVSEILVVMGCDPVPNVEDASTTPGDLGNSFELVRTESH